MKRITVSLAVAAGGVLLSLPSAYAVSWGSISSYYNGNKVVTGSGDLTDYGGIAGASITVTDSRNDGNAVYGKSQVDNKLGGVYYNVGAVSVPAASNTTKTASKTFTSTDVWNVAGWRGRHQVCAQMGFPVPNSCKSLTSYGTS
jgi:hypothetical protein